MRDNIFIITFSWMSSELGLSGNEMLLYACIYSFSKKYGRFCGSVGFLARIVGCSERTVFILLSRLVKKGLLQKSENEHGHPIYAAIRHEKKKTEDEPPCGAYIVTRAWMVVELGLSGKELLLYACLYSFSQKFNGYSGNVEHLSKIIGCSVRNVFRLIDNLAKKGLLQRLRTRFDKPVYRVFRTTEEKADAENSLQVTDEIAPDYDKISPHHDEIAPDHDKISPHHDEIASEHDKISYHYDKISPYHDKISPNNNNNKQIENNSEEIYKAVVDYLNEKGGFRYNPKTEATRKKIDARLGEGFSEEDFKTVIDKKIEVWTGTEFERYIRPETLFGDKFEQYLNERISPVASAASAKKKKLCKNISQNKKRNDDWDYILKCLAEDASKDRKILSDTEDCESNSESSTDNFWG